MTTKARSCLPIELPLVEPGSPAVLPGAFCCGPGKLRQGKINLFQIGTGPAANCGPKAAQVQRASNTQFEFLLKHVRRLDKITIWQHPLVRITRRTFRFGFGAGHEAYDGVAGGCSLVDRNGAEPCRRPDRG